MENRIIFILQHLLTVGLAMVKKYESLDSPWPKILCENPDALKCILSLMYLLLTFRFPKSASFQFKFKTISKLVLYEQIMHVFQTAPFPHSGISMDEN